MQTGNKETKEAIQKHDEIIKELDNISFQCREVLV